MVRYTKPITYNLYTINILKYVTYLILVPILCILKSKYQYKY